MLEDKRFAWDRHGNLIAKKTGSHKAQYLAYDAQGQLTHVLTRTGLTSATALEQLVAFAYDALGRRVAKRVWPAQALRNRQPDEPHQGKRSLPPPSFIPPRARSPVPVPTCGKATGCCRRSHTTTSGAPTSSSLKASSPCCASMKCSAGKHCENKSSLPKRYKRWLPKYLIL